jgi:hypothetical protein
MIGSYNVIHGTRLRFVTTAAVSIQVTYQNLLDLILIATGATTVVDLFHAVRIRKVRVWAVPVIGNAATVEVQFSGQTAGSAGNWKVVTDTSMGIEPAYVSASPGARSLASLFQQSGAAIAFALVCPSGSVVDVDLSFKNDPGLSVAAQNPAVGATAGALFYRGLDGLALAASKFTAVAGAQL